MRAAVLALLAPLALGLAACGGAGGGTSSATGNPIADAAAATAKQVSEHTTIDGRVALNGQTLVLSGEGGWNQSTREGWQQLRVSVPGSGRATVDGIFIKDVFWLKSALFAGSLPAGKQWVKVDLAKARKGPGFNFKLLGQTPGDVLEQLQRTKGPVKTVGTQKVDGVDTTHYRAAIDAAKVRADRVLRLVDARYAPLDVWVDQNALVRKVRLDYTAKADPSQPGRAHAVLTMTLSDFGETVDVQPPAASTVVDSAEQAGG